MAYSKAQKAKELKAEDLRWQCNPEDFAFDSTDDLEPIEGILGQERALKAIRLGVDIRSPGYNIFIAGLSGTGKATTVKKMLETISGKCPPLYDYVYVNNFKDTDRPVLLKFPVGKAKIFRQEMTSTIDILRIKIPQTLDSDTFINRKKKIVSHYNEKEQDLMGAFDEKLKTENFSLGQVKVGEVARPEIFPVIEQKPVPIYQLEEMVKQGKITEEKAKDTVKKYNSYQQELHNLFRKGLKLSQEFQEKFVKLERETAEIVVKGVMENLREKYNQEKTLEYLSEVENNILDSIQVFKGVKPEGEVSPEGFQIDYFKEYEVNIILDNSDTKKCPVIIETSPNYVNLFGTIEKIYDGQGGWYSDFTKIKAGSLLRANGGYLVLNVKHLFEEQSVWQNFKKSSYLQKTRNTGFA